MTQPAGTDKAREMLERLGRLAARKELDTVAIRRTDLEALLTLPPSPLVGEGLVEPGWKRDEARIKDLMTQAGHPKSLSLFQAFKQLALEIRSEPPPPSSIGETVPMTASESAAMQAAHMRSVKVIGTLSPAIGETEERLAVRVAYGLLWHMQIDQSDFNLRLASEARRTLLTALSTDEQADGIARAKAVDGRFTGAA